MRRIGVGGMGEVFFAWAYGVARTRKPVVVKVLRPEMLSEPGAAEMFVEEGRLSLQLSHSNILQVFDFGKADDRFFMAMEYVDGFHLGDLRKRAGGKLPPDHAAFIAMDVCLGLDYAHRLKDERGVPLHIVHRDVTPSNVLISREGEVKLADFGIARATGRSQHTQAGQIRGKVRYMSPEAARGEPLDHRADVFSLGAMLFEMLSGRKAFDAKGREAVLQQIVASERGLKPSDTGEEVHPALDAVVAKALAPRREDRYADAFALHRAIEGACGEAGYRPSRGSFLEFLRKLDDEESASASKSESDIDRPTRTPSPETLPVGGVTPRSLTPDRQAGDRRASGASEEWQAREAEGRPGDRRTPSLGKNGEPWPTQVPVEATVGVAPPGRDSRPSKPSSSTVGTVPVAIDIGAPEGTALPTAVASPVLFTLQRGAERTPSLESVPRFEVTKFEAPPAERTTDEPLAVPVAESPSNAPTERKPRPEPDRRASEEAEGRPSDRASVPTAPAIRMPAEDDLEPEPGGAWRSRRSAQTAPRTAEIADYPVLRRKPARSGSAWIFASVAVFVALVALVFALREDPGTARVTPVRTRATPLATPTRMAIATPEPTQETPQSTPYQTPEPTRVVVSTPRVTPPPRTPTPLPTAAAFGIVDINSDPWSEVLVNGQLLKEAQHTPYRRVRLPAGPVELAFRRNGTVVKTITVNVRSGENPAILVSLPR